ncbi:hypothetical protein Golomagni_02688 [Golovinomyces magnicellulatus]|nr:hypothetical protein Golomagni_02688 [Golovinomyces magnicellulatus]
MLLNSRSDRRNTEPNFMDPTARLQFSMRSESRVNISSHSPKEENNNELDDNLMRHNLSVNLNTEHSMDGEKRNMRNSALRIFDRYRRKKSINSENLLPSEISRSNQKSPVPRQNTSDSLPSEKKRRASFKSFERRSPRRQVSELGTVTVLKPVSEHTESFRLSNKTLRDSAQSKTSIGSQVQNKNQALYYTESTLPPDLEAHSHPLQSRSRGDHQILSPEGKWERGNDVQPEYMRSGSSISHSSNSTSSKIFQSENSTSRCTTPDPFPPRKSSKYYNSGNGEVNDRIKKNENSTDEIRATTPPPRQIEFSSVSPLVFGTGTAKLARSFSGAGIERACIVRCSSPSQYSLTNPTAKTHSLLVSRPTSPANTLLHIEQTQSTLECSGECNEAAWITQKKTGRTITRNVRETISFQNPSRSSGLRSMCDSPVSSIISQPSTPNPKSQMISLSNIMTVATVPPDFEQFNEPAIVSIKRRESRNLTMVPGIAIATALNSTDSENDDQEYGSEYRLRKAGMTPSNRSVESFINHPRAPRRLEHFNLERERAFTMDQDVNSRLNKMERDNKMLLATLTAIVEKIGYMSTHGTSFSGAANDGNESDELIKGIRRNHSLNKGRDSEESDDSEKRVDFNEVNF